MILAKNSIFMSLSILYSYCVLSIEIVEMNEKIKRFLLDYFLTSRNLHYTNER